MATIFLNTIKRGKGNLNDGAERGEGGAGLSVMILFIVAFGDITCCNEAKAAGLSSRKWTARRPDTSGGTTMRDTGKRLVLFLPLLLLAVCVLPAQASEDPPRISAEELRDLLGSPGLVVLDVRLTQDWKKSDKQIPGAIRENPHRVKRWIDKYPKNKKIVLYCS
jgi:hypothetical protein